MEPMSPHDRRSLDVFAARVRALAPATSICAFGSRARGLAHPDSDLDLCVVLPAVTRDLRDAIYRVAWEIGFEEGRVLAPIILSEEDFERAPLSASTLVANIRRDGIAA
jgi:predicted nucleotidyltransferase